MANVDLDSLIEAVSKPLGAIGRQRIDRAQIVRAHFMAFIHPAKIESVSALHRTLDNDATFRYAVGFGDCLPSLPTFLRTFWDMARFPELVEKTTAELVRQVKSLIPDLGREIAIDSTPVKSRSNPNFDPPSDPDAVWIRHDKAGAKGGQEWEWGHRLQITVDANYNIPLWIKLSRENNDSPQLIPLLEDMDAHVGDLGVEAVLADRGYDSSDNCVYLHERGIEPIIHKRKPKENKKTGHRLHPGGYNTNGVPTCDCGVAMDYVGKTRDGRYLYRCSSVGDGDAGEQARDFQEKPRVCAGEYGDAGVACREDTTVDPKTNVWLFGGRLRRMGAGVEAPLPQALVRRAGDRPVEGRRTPKRSSFPGSPSDRAAHPSPGARAHCLDTNRAARGWIMKERLTDRQAEVLRAIAALSEHRPYPPTIREIQVEADVSSTSVASYRIRALERMGYLNRTPRIARGIVITETGRDLLKSLR